MRFLWTLVQSIFARGTIIFLFTIITITGIVIGTAVGGVTIDYGPNRHAGAYRI